MKVRGEAAALKDTNSDTYEGEPAAPAGLLGRGKLIPSCTTVGSEMTISGDSPTGEKWTNDILLVECGAGTAP